MTFQIPTSVQGIANLIGTGDAVLSDVLGAISWSTVPDGSSLDYYIKESPDSASIEWGLGTKTTTAGKPVLHRDSVLGGSSGFGTLIKFTGPKQIVFSAILGERASLAPNVVADPSVKSFGQAVYRTDLDQYRVYVLSGFQNVLLTSTLSAALSGSVVSGSVLSGSVFGFFGPVRDIASGTIGVFDFGSGAVIAGTVGSGAVQSGNIASGQIGINHLQSGLQISGLIQSGGIGSGSVIGQAGGSRFNIGSGTIGSADLSSGIITSGVYLGSGVIFGVNASGPRLIASGSIGSFDLGSGVVSSFFPISDSTVLLQDDGDTSKQLRVEIGGFTTGQTRVLTPQDVSYTLAGLEIAQTFTANQTISVEGTTQLILKGVTSDHVFLQYYTHTGSLLWGLGSLGSSFSFYSYAGISNVVFDIGSLGAVTSTIQDSATTTITTCHTITHQSTGTPASGFGLGIQYQLNSSTTANRNAAEIDVSWTNATDATRKARVTVNVYDTTIREAIRFESDGSHVLTAFGGAVISSTFVTLYPLAGDLGLLIRLAGTASDAFRVQNSVTQSVFIIDGFGATIENMGQGNPAGMFGIGRASTQTSATGVGNGADTTDDTLFTYSLPINTLSSAGKGVRVRAWGTTAANANSKDIKLWFAGSIIIDSGVLNLNASDWSVEMEIARIDATHVSCVGTWNDNGLTTADVKVTANLIVSDLTANTSVVKVTGASTVVAAANDVKGYGMKVWFEN